MKNRKQMQILGVLLAASLAMISAVSCSQGKDTGKTDNTPKTPGGQTPAETEETMSVTLLPRCGLAHEQRVLRVADRYADVPSLPLFG